MKIKLWQWEYDFDRDDAKIVVPLILVILGLAFTRLNKEVLWVGGAAYYLLLFFLVPTAKTLAAPVVGLARWLRFRCPHCKSRDVILQGYQGYHSDEQYAHYLCNHCCRTAILVNDRLIEPAALSTFSRG